MKSFVLAATSAFLLISIFACRKTSFTEDSSAKINFSKDTVLFDTVFTTVGSTTKRFTIRNENSKGIRISKMMLAGGNSSFFRLNLDGVSGIEFEDIEIPSEDSLWVFVEVTLDPNNQNNPLIVTDSVVFFTNGNEQDVDLVAWGQDAYFYGQVGGGQYVCGETWNNDKPHVVYGFAVVDTNCTLTINEGAQIYFHENSGIAVELDAKLIVNGITNSQVVFQGDRLEGYYNDLPGQWFGLWFRGGSSGSVMNHAIVKNSNYGIFVDGASDTSTFYPNTNLTVNNTYSYNHVATSIWGRGSIIRANNCVFANAGQFCGAYTLGGNYEFRHCTFANYYSYSNRQTPTILATNYQENQDQTIDLNDLENCYFGNCIVFGNLEHELGFDEITGTAFNYLFDNTLVKVESGTDLSDASHYQDVFVNLDPNFERYQDNNYRLDTLSPAENKGNPVITQQSPVLFQDIEGLGRKLAPDLGAHERQ